MHHHLHLEISFLSCLFHNATRYTDTLHSTFFHYRFLHRYHKNNKDLPNDTAYFPVHLFQFLHTHRLVLLLHSFSYNLGNLSLNRPFSFGTVVTHGLHPHQCINNPPAFFELVFPCMEILIHE